MSRRRPLPRGVTLVEVLMSAVIVGIAFAVLAQGLVAAARASSTSQAYSRAVMVATLKMAEIESGAHPTNMGTTETVEDDLHTFEVTVTPVQTDQAGLVEVTVEVKWTMRGREHRTALVRYLHEALRKST